MPALGINEVNLEAVAALKPDLIIGTELQGIVYDKLANIAPTVILQRGTNSNWRQRFRDLAIAVGREQEGQDVETAYETEIADLPDAARDTTVAFIRSDLDGNFRIDGGASAFAGSVARDAGIPLVEMTSDLGSVDPQAGYLVVSGEKLMSISSAELIVVGERPGEIPGEDGRSYMATNPLWDRLPAVEEGHDVGVPHETYNAGHHYGARMLLRAIGSAVGGTVSPQPSASASPEGG